MMEDPSRKPESSNSLALPSGQTGRKSPQPEGSKRSSLFRIPRSKPDSKLQEENAQEGLVFKDVCVDVADKRILWSVSGHARPGHVLAVLGPSGSGKTTLLNTLAGYVKKTSGSVTLSGQKISKRNRRKMSYVLQADIFFPNLTLRETIRYSALLRLPREYSVKEKLEKVEEIIRILRLQDCASTIIGGPLVRGLSGGEKKRANIGCELLTDPKLLLLDEPTSGLDSSSALNLMEILRNVAQEGNKIVVTSIHQPSSQLFHMFDGLLLMAKGKVAYFGEASAAMDYVASVGLRCTMHYNPADYLLELVTRDESRKVLIGEDPKQEERPIQRSWWQRCLHWPRPQKPSNAHPVDAENVKIEEYPSSPRLLSKRPSSITNPPPAEDSGVDLSSAGGSSDDPSDETESNSTLSDEGQEGSIDEGRVFVNRKWATRWYWQFMVLIVRTFRESRHNLLSKLNLVQAVLLSIVSALVWFQVPRVEESISDGYGYLFFSIIFWSFNSVFGAAFTFPQDHVVVSKERASGMYHLSAYFMAKLVSELPLVLFNPTLFFIITYLASGLGGATGFFGTLTVLIITCLVGQSFGLLLGATVMNLKRVIVFGSVCILTFMLLGGFYVKDLPSWLQWAQYISFVKYGFDAALQFTFTPETFYSCNVGNSIYSVCINGTSINGTSINGTISMANGPMISGLDVLDQLDVTLPVYVNIIVLLGFALVFRVLAYFALRYLHRNKAG